MNNIDRILRVLYSDVSLAELAIWNFGSDWDSLSLDTKVSKLINTKFYFSDNCDIERSGSDGDKQWQSVVERYMRSYPNDYNDDEVALIFNSVRSQARRTYPLHEFNSIMLFPYCAKTLLNEKGDEIFVKSNYLFEWEGIINKIDQNILLSAYSAFEGTCDESYFFSAKHSDERLRKILSKGFAENHAHLKGSGYSPEISWFAFLYTFHCNLSKCLKCLEGVVKARWRDLDHFEQDKMLLAFEKIPIIRALLFAFVGSEKDKRGEAGSTKKEFDWERYAPNELDDMIRRVFLVQDEFSLRLLMDENSFVDVMENHFLRGLGVDFHPTLESILEMEQSFLRRLFSFLKWGELSATAVYALNVYIAAISQFKFCVVQDNFNIGFKRFSRFERKKDVFVDLLGNGREVLLESVFEKYYRSGGVKYAEFRVSPKPNAKKQMLTTIRELKRANKKSYKKWRKKWKERGLELDKIDFGLIVHYIKDEDAPDTHCGIGRKEKAVDNLKRLFLCLENVYELGYAHEFDSGINKILSKIVGIDAANFEITTRAEVFGPLFRTFSSEISSRFATGITYHAGEDFTTLANGLRAIDEAIAYLELDECDRIGHATAMGIDVDDYFENKRGYITNSLQDQVDDIAWMHKTISGSHFRDAAVLSYLENQYYKYIGGLFYGACVPVPDLETYKSSMELRGDDPETIIVDPCDSDLLSGYRSKRFLKNGNERSYISKGAQDLFCMYQFDQITKENGMRALVIEADSDYLDAVKLVQKIMINKVHDKRITVEANPSSNRKISFARRFIELQLFKLNNRGLRLPNSVHCDDTPDVPVTINTDNGGVFQTDLALEYAFIVEAMRRAGIDAEDIYQYIDYLRELSLEQNFVCKKL